MVYLLEVELSKWRHICALVASCPDLRVQFPGPNPWPKSLKDNTFNLQFTFYSHLIYNSVADYNSSRVDVGCMSYVCMADVPIPFS